MVYHSHEIDIVRSQHLNSTIGSESKQVVEPVDIFAYLVRKSQTTLSEIYRHSRKPIEAEMISATALFFYKFYLGESVVKYDPRAVFVACMNLAAKTEEYHSISLSDLINALPDAVNLKTTIPLLEMKVLKSLEFNLVVEQPWQVMLYWVEAIRSQDDPPQAYHKIYDMACDILKTWQWTDAVLVFEFPQLATAAVFRACIISDRNNSAADGASPDEITAEKWAERFLKIVTAVIPGVDVEKLLAEVEGVAYRFGAFEKIAKDPQFSSSEGYKSLVAIVANLTNR